MQPLNLQHFLGVLMSMLTSAGLGGMSRLQGDHFFLRVELLWVHFYSGEEVAPVQLLRAPKKNPKRFQVV